MKKAITVRVLLLSLAVLAASCSIEQEAATTAADPVKGAEVEQVALSTIDDYCEVTGTVRSATTSTLSARVMGTSASGGRRRLRGPMRPSTRELPWLHNV
ncbi:MAG TPA: hypothetical protein VNO14_19600 [Blastocatellia bacterium]|nr:hypothetical protein [Blastocatellia bacterium]